MPPELASNVLDPGNKLKQRFAQRGIRLERDAQPAITGLAFNMEDPVVGGYDNDRIALRRAIAMTYDAEEDARVIRHGQARRATQFIPPNVSGHNPKLEKYIRRDVAGARALLDKFGYVDRDGDGLREAARRPAADLALFVAAGRAGAPAGRAACSAISRNWVCASNSSKQKWPDQLKAARLGQLQMWQAGKHQRDVRRLHLPLAAVRRECRVLQPDAVQAAGIRSALTCRRARSPRVPSATS